MYLKRRETEINSSCYLSSLRSYHAKSEYVCVSLLDLACMVIFSQTRKEVRPLYLVHQSCIYVKVGIDN